MLPVSFGRASRPHRVRPCAGSHVRRWALVLAPTFLVAACDSSTPPTTSSISPTAAAMSAVTSEVGDSSWQRLDVDVEITTSMETGDSKRRAPRHTRRMHVERASGPDGRWYTRYTLKPELRENARVPSDAPHPEVSELFTMDDRSVVRMTRRNGHTTNIGVGGPSSRADEDIAALLSAPSKARVYEADRALAGTRGPSRTAHWLDGTVIAESRRTKISKRLTETTGIPTIDARGRPTFVSERDNRKIRVVLDPSSGDIEEAEMNDPGRGAMHMQVEHARLSSGRAVRSRIRYEITRATDQRRLVTDIRLSNHRLQGGLP